MESAAVRIRPVTTRPATNPAMTSTNDNVRRRTISSLRRLADVDSPRAAARGLGNRDRENAVFEIGSHRVDIDRFRKREGAREMAMAALDAMKLLGRDVA